MFSECLHFKCFKVSCINIRNFGSSLHSLSVLQNCLKLLQVITDTAVMDEAEIAYQGAGAVAMLVGRSKSSKIAIEIERKNVPYMKNTNDFLKPRYSKQLSPFMRGRESMDGYLNSLEYCVTKTKER